MVSSGKASDSFSPTQLQSHELADRLGLVEQVLHARVAEVVAELHAVDPQHDRQRIGPPSLARSWVEGADAFLQQLPRDEWSIRSRNISRGVFRFLPWYSRSANDG